MNVRLLASVLVFCSSFIIHHSSFAQKVDHSILDTLLKQNVRDERVDYANIKANGMDSLHIYLKALAQVKTETLAREDRLAYYINLYNATMIREVIGRMRPGWTAAANDFAVFKEPTVITLTGKMSLNDLEHKVIRPEFKDPRIHAALVCGAISCPPLLPRAYLPDDLDAVLEQNMRRFINDPKRNPIDANKKELKLSQIFEWYPDDFGGKANIPAYVDKYHPANTAGWKVSFVPYSWELNGVR